MECMVADLTVRPFWPVLGRDECVLWHGEESAAQCQTYACKLMGFNAKTIETCANVYCNHEFVSRRTCQHRESTVQDIV
jgi:hypothetical protein